MSTDATADGEALAIAILLDHLGDDTEISTGTPTGRTEPWIRVRQVNAEDQFRDYLVTYVEQIECYAGQDNDSVSAAATARTCRQALHNARNRAFGGSRVTNTEVTGPGSVPDPDMKPARERYILTARITARPD